MLSETYQIGSNGPKFYSAGLIGIKSAFDFPNTPSDDFTDELLELLTDQPEFAFIQYLFSSLPLSKKKSNLDKQKQLKFDIQKGRVEEMNLSQQDLENRLGKYLFSPRIIIVEKSQERLQSKIDQLKLIFHDNGMKLQHYSSYFSGFKHIQSLCLKRRMKHPMKIDGFSLMKIISLPQRQHAEEGYTIVPNKFN
jgi:hypothetical protein